MKKKLVGLMLSGMLVLSLAACGGDDAAADSTTVSTQAEVSTTSDTVAEEVTTEEVTTEEVTVDDSQHCHLLMVDSFPLYLMEMEMHRWYRAEVLSMEPMRSEMTDL